LKVTSNIIQEVNISHLHKTNIENLTQMEARDVLFTLDSILHQGAKTIKDEAVSVSYLYLASIDGVF